jgi:hypothetical protein
VSNARNEKLGATTPRLIRTRLLELGILPGDRLKRLTDEIYGIGSEESAHPGFPTGPEAEWKINLMHATMMYVIQSYDACIARGYALPAEPVDVDRDVERLRGAFYNRVVRSPDLATRITLDATGLREVTYSLRRGAEPAIFKLTVLNQDAAEKMFRALEEGEAVGGRNTLR